MKRFRILTIALAAILVLPITSCKKWIDPDHNVDPTNPQDVPLSLLLPSAQAAIAYSLGGDIGRYCSLFTQHNAGTSRQHLSLDQYNLQPSDVNNSWRFSLYSGALVDLVTMIAKATNDENSPHYRGVARVLLANILGVMTDLWGNIPYSTAFLGADQLKPTYDDQQALYGVIQGLLDDGIADLGAATSDKSPGGDDLIYGGDLTAWTMAANMLKARYHNHLSQVNAAQSAADALAALGGGFGSAADDMAFNFGTAVTEQNPWFQFADQRDDIGLSSTFVDAMLANGTNGDPRLPFFADDTCTGGVYCGTPNGAPTTEYARMGAYYGSVSSPVPFVTYVEGMFISAEAKMRSGDATGAAADHNAAVIASVEQVTGATAPAQFVTDVASETAGTITMDIIMTQKWIAMFSQAESWVDWRRTGLPALTPAANAQSPGGVIPLRWPYPETEDFYNGDNVNAASNAQGFSDGGSIVDALWWDQ